MRQRPNLYQCVQVIMHGITEPESTQTNLGHDINVYITVLFSAMPNNNINTNALNTVISHRFQYAKGLTTITINCIMIRYHGYCCMALATKTTINFTNPGSTIVTPIIHNTWVQFLMPFTHTGFIFTPTNYPY